MIIPKEFDPKDMARLEWNLTDFLRTDENIVPKESLIYRKITGETSIRFINYDKKSIKEKQDEYIENMDIETPEIILEGRYYPIKRIFQTTNGKILGEKELLSLNFSFQLLDRVNNLYFC